MGLSLYNKKRDFKQTTEPKGKVAKPHKELLFVIQKHNASHLHYDFRLEMKGVLKSWAVPKGPSMNPEDKRLAMHVEDHPYNYKDFEGIIPEGNYGAGEVIVWDNGTYEAAEKSNPNQTEEKALLEGYNKGNLKIILHGKKLKGEFALVKMKGRGENAWLLIKKKDKYATNSDITKKNKSILSNRPVEDLKKNKSELTWKSNRAVATTPKKSSAKKSTAKSSAKPLKKSVQSNNPRTSVVKKSVKKKVRS